MVELHLTLSLAKDSEALLREWLSRHGGHLTWIELDRGLSRRQLMVTSRHDGDVESALLCARRRSSALETLPGLRVERVKLEVPLQTARELSGQVLYLEHHVKVRLRPEQLPALAKLGAQQRAHVSRNPFRTFEAWEERFLTQRFAPLAHEAADQALLQLVAALARDGFKLEKCEREAIVHDDNLDLDAGWGAIEP